MLFLTCLLFLPACGTTVTVSTLNDTISTAMILHFKSNVLTVYSDNNNTLIMNCHQLLCCNNFPTVPNRPYFNYHCTFYICMYIMYVICIISNQSILGILHVWTGTFPDLNRARSASKLCTDPTYDVFPLRGRHIVDQVVGLLPLGQCLLQLTRRISMSFQIWYRDLNI